MSRGELLDQRTERFVVAVPKDRRGPCDDVLVQTGVRVCGGDRIHALRVVGGRLLGRFEEVVCERLSRLEPRCVPPLTATLPVAESFGPTVQREGPATGRRAHFIRLGGCNLSCS
jgi:hypothetical protein